jgi:hypothetical protein
LILGTLYGIPKMNYNNILAKKETLINHFYNPIQKTAQFFYPSLEKNEEFKDKKIIATLRATSRRNSLFLHVLPHYQSSPLFHQ